MVSIAIFGTSGALGAPVLKALSSPIFKSKIEYPIKAITTKDKSSQSTDEVKYIQSEITDAKLIETLKGTDVIISLAHPSPEVSDALQKIVTAVKPKFYIPSEFGCENDKIDTDVLASELKHKNDHVEKVRAEGIKVVRIFTSFFRVPPVFLYVFTDHIGINQKEGVYTIVGDDEDKQVSFSTADDIGRTVAAIATTDASKVKDSYRVISGKRPIKEILTDIEKEQGKKFKVEKVSLEDQIKSYKAAPAFIPALFLYFSQGVGHGVLFKEVDNELINPGESLWKWEKWDSAN